MKKNAFTLIELLVVIAIIGLIGSLVAVAGGPARAKSRDTKRVTDLVNVQKGLQLMQGQMGTYPTGTNLNIGTATTQTLCGKGTVAAFVPNTSAANCNTDKIYVAVITAGTNPYIYNTTSPTSTYRLCTTLESGDPKLNLSSGPVAVDDTSGIKNVASCP